MVSNSSICERVFHDLLVEMKTKTRDTIEIFFYPQNYIYGTLMYGSGACWRSG